MSKCSVYLVWRLDNEEWVVVSAFNNKDDAQDYADEQMDNYNCEYLVTSALANRPQA
jgi:hypothetical protein